MKPINVNYTRVDPYLSVSTLAEAGELLDRIREEHRGKPPVMASIGLVEDEWASVLEIGIRDDVGFAHYAGADGAWGSAGAVSRPKDVIWYYFQGHDRDIPASAEVPYDTVEAAVLDYMTRDGDRPSVIEWVDA